MQTPFDAVQFALQVLRDPLFGIALSLLLFLLSKSSQQQRAPQHILKNCWYSYYEHLVQKMNN